MGQLLQLVAAQGWACSVEFPIDNVDMDNLEGAWILAIISLVGAVFAGLFKLVSKNGCSIACSHPNGNNCCTTDCEEGRAPIIKASNSKSVNRNSNVS